MFRIRTSSPAHAMLESLSGSLWICFLLVTGVISLVWFFDIGEAQIQQWIAARDPRAAFLWLSSVIDVAWFALAFALVYADSSRRFGLRFSRLWMLIVFAGGWTIAALSSLSAWPLGPVHFTGRFGYLLGPVPIGWTLLWYVVMTGARDLCEGLIRRASHVQIAGIAGLFGALTDLSLEPLAANTRAWWIWMPKAPGAGFHLFLQAALTWGVAAFTLSLAIRRPLSGGELPRVSRSAIIFLILHVLLLLAHLGRFLRMHTAG